MLTVKPGATQAHFLLPQVELFEFTLMVLYKISSGTISSALNIASIDSGLSLKFKTFTYVFFETCTLIPYFIIGNNQGDWLPLAVTYTGTELRAYRFG